MTELSPKLPPDVRDRAALAAHEAMYVQSGTRIDQVMAEAVVDAVAEVLAAGLEAENEELRLRLHAQHASNAEFMRGQAVEFAAERLQLKARVAEQSGEYVEALARADRKRDEFGAEIVALKARVDLLTTALTEIVVIVNHSSLSMSSTTTDLLLRSVSRASAVLSAGEEKS